VKTRVGAEGRLEQKSNTERIASWRDGLAVWKQNPFFGSGAGVFARSEATKQSQEKRDRHAPTKASGLAMTEIVEPPHNIFILVLSQLGLVGFAIYLFLWRGFWKSPALRPLLILFFAIGMPDHYLWTLYSGSMLFWLGLSFFDEA
jgi:O-antigen ligase